MPKLSLLCVALVLVVALIAAACSSDDGSVSDTGAPSESPTAATEAPAGADPSATADSTNDVDSEGASSSFTVEVWADNWFSLYVNGEFVGEDSVPITTERSFNAETFSFEATYPLTIAIEAKDFKETDSGIEYIGLGNQQMGDGGLIAQITDESTGEVIVVTNAAWRALVIHRAPLNTECEKDPDPDATCEFEIIDTPADWTSAGFDDSAWATATEWSAADVDPKDGYDQISWDSSSNLIWGTDLEVDNTILFRVTVSG